MEVICCAKRYANTRLLSAEQSYCRLRGPSLDIRKIENGRDGASRSRVERLFLGPAALHGGGAQLHSLGARKRHVTVHIQLRE